MTTYAVFTGADRPEPGDIEIVADRFSWFAFLAAGLWCLWHRLWVEFVAVLALAAALTAVGALVNPDLALNLGLLIALLIGFEASAIRERALIRRGFVRRTDIAARSAGEAELRWFASARRGTL